MAIFLTSFSTGTIIEDKKHCVSTVHRVQSLSIKYYSFTVLCAVTKLLSVIFSTAELLRLPLIWPKGNQRAFLVYLMRRSTIVQGKGFLGVFRGVLEKFSEEVLKNSEPFKWGTTTKWESKFLKWEIAKRIVLSFSNYFLYFKDFICVYNCQLQLL